MFSLILHLANILFEIISHGSPRHPVPRDDKVVRLLLPDLLKVSI